MLTVKIWVPLVLSRVFLRFSIIKLSEALHPKPSLAVFCGLGLAVFCGLGLGNFLGSPAKWRIPICSWAHCPADALFGETFETLP